MSESTETVEVPEQALKVTLERAEVEFDELMKDFAGNEQSLHNIGEALDDVRQSVGKKPIWDEVVDSFLEHS